VEGPTGWKVVSLGRIEVALMTVVCVFCVVMGGIVYFSEPAVEFLYDASTFSDAPPPDPAGEFVDSPWHHWDASDIPLVADVFATIGGTGFAIVYLSLHPTGFCLLPPHIIRMADIMTFFLDPGW